MKINWKAIPDAFKVLGKLGEKHLPTILTSLGVGGFIATAVLAAKEAPKAESAVRKAEKEKAEELGVEEAKLKPVEYIKTAAGYYWPSVVLGTASTVAILSAHKIDLTRLASVTAAYQLSKGELKELKNKIIQKDGEDKLKEYDNDIHADTLHVCSPSYIYNTGKGNTIFYEPMSNVLFYSDIWHVTRALQTVINACKNGDEYSLDELRDNLDLPKCPATRDYVFMYNSFNDTSIDSVEDLFEYHSIDRDNGDMRPCIWLDIMDRCFNTIPGSFRNR